MRTPLKGEPDFTSISDERLKGFIDLSQQMIFAYKHLDEEKTRVFEEVWKQLSNEYTKRLCDAPVPVHNSIHKIKTVKTIKKIKR